MAAPTRGPIAPAEGIARAAALLAKARQPAIGGLGTDVDGLRAALKLGARIGAQIDHAASAYTRTELRAVSDGGAMLTTSTETRQRADLVVFAGPGAVAHADHTKSLADSGGLYPWRGARGVICLSTGGKRPSHMAVDGDISALGDDVPLDRLIGLLRARLAGHPVAGNTPAVEALDATALQLKSAAFGVVIVDPADLDHVSYDSLQHLIRDLNAETRFSSISVPAAHHGRGASLVSLWTTGDRLPVGLGRSYPEQDDWIFNTERAVKAGEVDALLWISALGPDLPDWAKSVPTVALIHHGATASADVVIEVGVPGVTHAGTLTDAVRDGFVWMEPSAPMPHPSVADILTAIDAEIAGGLA